MLEELKNARGGHCSGCGKSVPEGADWYRAPGKGHGDRYCWRCGSAYNAGYAACEAASKSDKPDNGGPACDSALVIAEQIFDLVKVLVGRCKQGDE